MDVVVATGTGTTTTGTLGTRESGHKKMEAVVATLENSARTWWVWARDAGAAWVDEEAPTPTLPRRTALPLPDAAVMHVCGYLAASEVGALLRVCRSLNALLDPHETSANGARVVWRPHWRAWASAAGVDPARATRSHVDHAAFLCAMLEHARDDHAFASRMCGVARALKRFNSVHVQTLAGTMGRFPSMRIARAVTRRRPGALEGVGVLDARAGPEFRHAVPSFNRSVSFMVIPFSREQAAPRPPISAPGFVGYALDLLELRPSEEQYRETLLATFVYRDLTVWETLADARNAIATGAYVPSDPAHPFFCVLDDERSDAAIMDDDAPRAPHGRVLRVERAPLQGMAVAPWHEFRPEFRHLDPVAFAERAARRVVALEEAVRLAVLRSLA